jgi:hypothetical protein
MADPLGESAWKFISEIPSQHSSLQVPTNFNVFPAISLLNLLTVNKLFDTIRFELSPEKGAGSRLVCQKWNRCGPCLRNFAHSLGPGALPTPNFLQQVLGFVKIR